MFQRNSEIAKKVLDAVPAPFAALCAGIELADRALVPPIAANSELVKRAIEAGRRPADLEALAISDVLETWSEDAMRRLAPAEGSIAGFIARYPRLLPVSRACSRRLELGKHTKEGTNLTGLSSQKYGPAEWGEQVFHERVLQRALVETGS
jgi:hypothetical protein